VLDYEELSLGGYIIQGKLHPKYTSYNDKLLAHAASREHMPQHMVRSYSGSDLLSAKITIRDPLLIEGIHALESEHEEEIPPLSNSMTFNSKNKKEHLFVDVSTTPQQFSFEELDILPTRQPVMGNTFSEYPSPLKSPVGTPASTRKRRSVSMSASPYVTQHISIENEVKDEIENMRKDKLKKQGSLYHLNTSPAVNLASPKSPKLSYSRSFKPYEILSPTSKFANSSSTKSEEL
jgi:hypothetical protein